MEASLGGGPTRAPGPRRVDTPYGPLPGCPDCGVIPLRGPHVCEHGVTPAPTAEVSLSLTIEAPDLYRRLAGEGPEA